MSYQAMWVPGYVAAAEVVGGGGLGSVSGPLLDYAPGLDYTDVVGWRQGFGVHFRGKANQEDWFHFAIPTPVITDGLRVKLVKAFVMWSTTGGSQLRSVHVWDGCRTRLLRLDGLNVSGIYDGCAGPPPYLVEGHNMFTLPDPQIVYYGVGISVLIFFSEQSDSDVYFTSAGADFTT